MEPKYLELIRNWRNSPDIAMYMEYQVYITPEKHQEWYKQVVLNNDYYFVIHAADKPIGVTHINLFDEKNETAHVGLYIADKQARGTGFALKASLAILDFGFNNLGLNRIYAKTNQQNNEALSYNQFLGFEVATKNSSGFWLLEMDKQHYFSKRKELLKFMF